MVVEDRFMRKSPVPRAQRRRVRRSVRIDTIRRDQIVRAVLPALIISAADVKFTLTPEGRTELEKARMRLVASAHLFADEVLRQRTMTSSELCRLAGLSR